MQASTINTEPNAIAVRARPGAARADAQPDTADTADLHDETTQDLPEQACLSTLPVLEAAGPAPPDVRRPPAPAPGEILCDRYILERLVGSGGTAWIYRARDLRAERGSPDAQVAVKVPRTDVTDDERMSTRLQHEFEHARRLSHPHIVRVFDLQRDGPTGFMTMELIAGKTLSFMLREQSRLSEPLAWRILRACAQALSYAHAHGVIHGDLKPANVFVTPTEGVKIVDFGAAMAGGAEHSRIAAATPAYASPEVLEGQLPEARDDIFSFACVAYELLTGQHPFEHRPSTAAREEGWIPPRAPGLSAPQWLALLSGLAWRREQRPAHIEEFMAALASESQPVQAAPVEVRVAEAAAADLPSDLMPAQRAWGFVVFVMAAIGAIFLAMQREAEQDQEQTAAPAATEFRNPAMAAPVGLGRNESFDEQPLWSSLAAADAAENEPQEPRAAAPEPPPAAVPTPASSSARPAPLSEISFESSSVVTSASALAAVFIVHRSGAIESRAQVHWRAVSGSGAKQERTISASGTVEFSAGQTQRAIYVPLIHDPFAQGEKKFSVELHGPAQARLGEITRAEATILGSG